MTKVIDKRRNFNFVLLDTLNLMVLSSDNRFVISSGKGELLNIINLEMNMVIQNIEGSQDGKIILLLSDFNRIRTDTFTRHL